jgi:hypothetical protein
VFQGATGSSSFEQFNAISAPINLSKRDNGTPNYTTYYNYGNTVGTPQGNFVQTPGGSGYIPAPIISPLAPTGYDARVNLTDVDPTKGNLLTPGELDVAGPVDPSSGASSLYSMSPLYGVQSSDNNSTFFNSRTTNISNKNPADRSKLSPGEIQTMRDELNKTVVPTDNGTNSGGTNSSGNNPGGNNSGENNPGGAPGAAPGSTPTTPVPGAVDLSGSALSNGPLSNSAALSDKLPSGQLNSTAAEQPIGSSIQSGQGLQNSLLVAPAKQSKQLADLEKRFAKSSQKMDDVQATDKFNAEMRAQNTTAQTFDSTGKPVIKPAQPGAAGTGFGGTGVGGTGVGSGIAPDGGSVIVGNGGAHAGGDKPAAPAIKPILTAPDSAAGNQPYIITSLATGISAKGLAGLMKSGEDQMRQGKFTEAVTTYDTAEQVAPNNPFVPLGRSFAELGASYYSKSDRDLTSAITADPAILAGRYDLKGFLGEDRLKFVQGDLQDIADHEKGARPLVLLAFIAHNGGDDTTASKDLAEAAQRGGYDQMVKTLKQAWNLK